MRSPSSPPPGTRGDVLIQIVDALEARGLDQREYQLQEYVDVDALEQLLSTSSGSVEIQLTVKGVCLNVTPDSVEVVDDRSSDEDQT